MIANDTSAPNDARLYKFRNYQSIFEMPDWGSLAQWRKERGKIRRHLLLCTGLNRKTAAFRPKGKIVEQFDHEGLVVENIQIETLPGLYVMGNLYRPKVSQTLLPLVLHPHGHSMRSRTVPSELFSVPHRAMNHALNGFAAFAWSMIGYDLDSLQIEHRTLLSGREKKKCNLWGLSTFGLQIHNGIKILDYFCRRKDIDKQRIGCTGESGGATQTYYLAGLDDRIRVAAPCVMLSGHFQGGCVCENAPHLHLEYSTVHYAALIAPRPLLLTGCTGDWTHHLPEREYKSLSKLYRLYGKEKAINVFYQDESHNYNRRSRERVYAWMKRWLKDSSFKPKWISESKKPVPQPEQLLVHKGPILPMKNVVASQKSLIRTWLAFRDKSDSTADLLNILNVDFPDKSDLLVRNRVPGYASTSRELGSNRIDYGRFSEGSHIISHFVLPEKGKQSVLILRNWKNSDAWKQFIMSPSVFVRKMINRGEGVIIPMIFGQNISDNLSGYRAQIEASYLYTSFNRTLHEHQIQDLATTVGLATSKLGISPKNLAVVAERGISLIGLVGWCILSSRIQLGPFAGDFKGLDFVNPSHWAKHAYCPLILKGGGMKSLSRLCGRRKGIASGVLQGQGKHLPTGFSVRPRAIGLDGLLRAVLQI